MKTLVLAIVVCASAALALLRRRRRQDTLKSRLTGYDRSVKDRL